MSLPKGAVVVVTGASGALGRETSHRLIDAGATVIGAGRESGSLMKIREELGAHFVPTAIDLLDEPATLAWGHELVTEYGRIDGLLHLVGGWKGGRGIVDADLTDWDFLNDNLIRTLQHASRALHDALLESPDGRLAIISSTGVAKPTAKNAAYVAAKAAAEAWTGAVADSFDGSCAAAVAVRVMALLTAQMREAKPDARFAGFTPTSDAADALLGLWDEPARTLNGRVLDLTT